MIDIPAIARWTAIDPVTHFDFSTYSAFDNNPVYWSDPSGADSEDYYGKYDLEWGGYMMDPGDRGYSSEGQNYGYFFGDFHRGLRLDEVLVKAPKNSTNEEDQEYFMNEEDRDRSPFVEYMDDAMEDSSENNKGQTERDRNRLKLMDKLNDKIYSLSKEITKAHRSSSNYKGMVNKDIINPTKKEDGGIGAVGGGSMAAARNERDSVNKVKELKELIIERDSIQKTISNN
ncbi:hypothetical protein N9E56_01485 [Flavobacteriaceae bacterium]|nr:hypothetical protein [Flavobacteriaceae bacterium]